MHEARFGKPRIEASAPVATLSPLLFMPSIAVIGASNDRSKYGNQAVRSYLAQGWNVYPVNPRDPIVEGLPAFRSIAELPGPVDRASLYVPPSVGLGLLEAIAARGAKELWVNPGSGSPELLARAEELGLLTVEACSIIAAADAADAADG
jgi:acyl-CoA synthetase (NDP forming)